jgi:hypothetical protein
MLLSAINFTLIAEQVPGGEKFSRVPVSVRILDVNDNFPGKDSFLGKGFMRWSLGAK